MAIQNLQPVFGGNSSALHLSAPTIVKVGAGTFWNINLINFGDADGYLYDAASLTGLTENLVFLRINPNRLTIGDSDLAGSGPFRFFTGLVFVPGSDGMVASISYT